MAAVYRALMDRLYGYDVWEGFAPQPGEPDVQGWNGNHPSLALLASSPGPKIVIDVGVWKGQSTINMAKAMKEHGIDGAIIGIDTFLGSPEHWSRDQPMFRRAHGLPDLYWQFMSNVATAGLTDYIIPMPQTSTTAANILKRLDIEATVIHVDAAHEYREVLNDLEDYWPLLNKGGFLIGDDYHPAWPGVIRAAGEFSAKILKPLAITPPKFILQK
jgi:predicted O-methyltransferase YrrM